MRAEVLDLEGLEFQARAILPLIIPALKLLDLTAPNSLEFMYVINAPIFFNVLFTIVKPMLSKHTQSKIKVSGSDYQEVSFPLTKLVPYTAQTVLFVIGAVKYGIP